MDSKIWEDFGLLWGFFKSLSSSAEKSTGISTLRDKVHMFGSTFAWYWDRPQGSIALGGWGQGSTPSLKEPGASPVPRSNYYLTIIYGLTIATSYKF